MRPLLVALTIPLLISCGAARMELPAGYAIVYGVADYNGTGYDLSFPDDDAVAVAGLLAANGYQVILRTNEAATKENLLRDFADVAVLAETDSRFLFYFAGHGFGDGMAGSYVGLPAEWREYFATQSGEAEPAGQGPFTEYLFLHYSTPITADVEASLEEAVSDDELAELVASVPSRQRVVVIDACHSGGFIGSGSSTDAIPHAYDGSGEGTSVGDVLDAITLYIGYRTQVLADLLEQDAVVITAAGEQEFSYEYAPSAGIPHGVFTWHFLQSARYGDRNYDGFITAAEAYAYAAAAIRSTENVRLVDEGKFHPRTSGGAVDFVLFAATDR